MNVIEQKLLGFLEKLYDNDDFITGIFSNADHEEDRNAIIDHIEKGDDVTVENVILLSLYLDNKRNHPERNLKKVF